MQITLNTAESSTDELTALIALLASLGGRLPSGGTHFVVDIDVTDEARRVAEHAEVNQGRRGPPTGEEPAAGQDALTVALDNVDSAGIPWDERIHSSSKERNKSDDTWRKRRGVSDEMFGRVMEELRAAISDGSYFASESANEMPDDLPVPPPPADEEVPLAPSDDSVPVPPAPTEETPSEPEPAASAPVAGDGQFADFASFVAAVSKHGKSYAELNEMAGVVGVTAFKDLKDHADKWDMFFSMIG